MAVPRRTWQFDIIFCGKKIGSFLCTGEFWLDDFEEFLWKYRKTNEHIVELVFCDDNVVIVLLFLSCVTLRAYSFELVVPDWKSSSMESNLYEVQVFLI